MPYKFRADALANFRLTDRQTIQFVEIEYSLPFNCWLLRKFYYFFRLIAAVVDRINSKKITLVISKTNIVSQNDTWNDLALCRWQRVIQRTLYRRRWAQIRSESRTTLDRSRLCRTWMWKNRMKRKENVRQKRNAMVLCICLLWAHRWQRWPTDAAWRMHKPNKTQ